jgi:hypothetical protein
MAPRAGGFTLFAALQAGATTPHPIAARDSADRAGELDDVAARVGDRAEIACRRGNS